MLGWFPSPYPDELLYSICARYGDRMKYQNKEAINSELFGSRGKSAIIDLPSYLGYLAANLPEGHLLTVARLIESHTLLSVFGPFLTIERVKRIRFAMEGSGGSAIHKIAGITPATIRSSDWIRFCPSCVELDRQSFGECYWHRLHQVTGVEVCPIHCVFLENSTTPARNRINRALYISAEESSLAQISKPISDSDPSHRVLLNIAQDVSWLLTQRGLVPDYGVLHETYIAVLKEKGLASRRGRLKTGELNIAMKAFYSPALLNQLQCSFDEQKKWSWPFRLIKELIIRKSNPPIRHLLLIHLLGYRAESFFNLCNDRKAPTDSTSLQPFGNGPWPCLNPTCKSYRRKVITICAFKRHDTLEGSFTGTFSCACGFTYTRNSIDTSPEDIFRRDKIKVYGKVWDKALCNFWEDSKLSVHKMAPLLGVSRNTSKYQAVRLGLKFPRSGPGPKITRMDDKMRTKIEGGKRIVRSKPQTRAAYRNQWLKIMMKHPEASRSKLISLHTQIYYWLLTNDAGWFEVHAPAPIKRTDTNRKVDWISRDKLVEEKVRLSALRLRTADDIPVRVTVQAIGRHIDKKDLLSKKHIHKLPLTQRALLEVVETKLEFYTRRLTWTANYFRQERIVPAFSTLGLKANIGWSNWYVPEVKAVIEEEIEKLRKEAESGWAEFDETC